MQARYKQAATAQGMSIDSAAGTGTSGSAQNTKLNSSRGGALTSGNTLRFSLLEIATNYIHETYRATAPERFPTPNLTFVTKNELVQGGRTHARTHMESRHH